ncbi:MAG TPA: hypothetical protein DCE41_33820 [Cytophagales bacterium]|nr:hypothetical protein [Cytophagales bacterium]HAA24271.1 hypothetical protein [Cytophagales bacterium]HAP59399.1 hypothetical protein [Cytophagales bacterium]
MGEFDKILKENIEALLLPLSGKLLGIRIQATREVKEKLQSTIEREPDFLKWVTDDTGAEFLLHLEFQTQDDPKMVYRMAEYKALLLRKFEVSVRQFVLYLGVGQSKMVTDLPAGQEIKGYALKNLSEIPLDQTLHSSVPEEILLAILGDYPREEGVKVIKRIIERLWSLQSDETTRQHYLQHLVILSRLRKLDSITEEIADQMPITYDIETDHFYQKGRSREKEEIIKNMLADSSFSLEEIARLTNTSLAIVQKIQGGNTSS